MATYLILTTLLTLLAAAYSYAADMLTLDQAIDLALRNNPGLKTLQRGVQSGHKAVGADVKGHESTVQGRPEF